MCSYRKDTGRMSHNYAFIFLKQVSKFTLLKEIIYHLRSGFCYVATTTVVLGTKTFLKLNFKKLCVLVQIYIDKIPTTETKLPRNLN